MKKPNIVFFFTDDQRFDTIRALGNAQVITPNMDKLVKNGVSFTHAHIPGGTHGAVCQPSRAMLHTGKTLYHLEKNGGVIPQEDILLGQHLQNQGYSTWGTGKWHNGRESFNRSFMDGDEIMFGGMGDHWNVEAYHYDPSGKYSSKIPQIKEPFKNRDVVMRNADHIPAGTHSSELFCDAAVNWLKDYKENDPYFMYISFMAPHDPRSMPEEFKNMYDPESIEVPENFLPEHSFDYGVSQIRDELLAPYPRTKDEVKTHLAEYYGMITHLDNEMGKLMKVIEDRGELDNTLIVFAGDNGLALGQHGLFGKQSSYDHSVRVPMIFSGPGIPKGEQRDQFCYLLDIYPTLCDLLGVEIPSSVEGSSLTPCFSNPEASHRDELYFAYGALVRAIRIGNEKLIEYNYEGSRYTQLFDLEKDPFEKDDQSKNKPERVQEMRAALLKQKEAWDDTDHPTSIEFWKGF